MSTLLKNIRNSFKTVNLPKKPSSLNFNTKGLKASSNTGIRLNDVDITVFTLVPDVVQVEFSSNNVNLSGRTRITEFKTVFNNTEKIAIKDPSLPGAGTKKISKGLVSHIEVVSSNSTTNVGIANVHVFMDGVGDESLYNTLNTTRVITSNTTFLVSDDGGIANNKIIKYFPKYSAINVATSNTIQIVGKVVNSEIANTLSPGTTIFIVSGIGAGQNATVASYNTSTRTITIVNQWDLIPGAISNNQINITERSMVRFDRIKADQYGTVSGKLVIPNIFDGPQGSDFDGYNYYRRWNGFSTNILKIYDDANKISFRNNVSVSQTEIVSKITKHGSKDNKVSDDTGKRSDALTPGGTSYLNTPTGTISSTYSSTPFAQTFFVDDGIYPQGISLLSCKLLFHSKDSELPVQVQIRPVTAGVPDPLSIIQYGNSTLLPNEIPTLTEAELKNLNVLGKDVFASNKDGSANTYVDGDGRTRYLNSAFAEAFFRAPVFLESGKEYAIVVMSPSPNHKVYIAQIGQKLFGTNRTISAQPYLGVLYKSQGTSSWTASPNEDLCFELTKAQYSTTPAIVDFYLKTPPADYDNYGFQGVSNYEMLAPRVSLNVTSFYVMNPELILANTNITYQYKTTRSDEVTQDEFKNLELGKTYDIYDTFGRRIINSSNNSFVIRATMTTKSRDIAPSLDFSDMTLLRMENIIDNGTISNNSVYVTNYGLNYSNAQNVIVTISGGGGSGATAVANVVNGIVDAIIIKNGGEGYTSTPTITISSDTTSTVNAEAVIVGEDQTNGGIADSKYITKIFTLAEDFQGGDLRVIFNAIKPSECEIDVYYKVRSQDDAESFDVKSWIQMTLIGGINDYSLDPSDYRKYLYAPGKNNIADNLISYDGFTTFKDFAIKIVMRTTEISKVPIIKDLRITALAELLT